VEMRRLALKYWNIKITMEKWGTATGNFSGSFFLFVIKN